LWCFPFWVIGERQGGLVNSVAWVKENGLGFEFADVNLQPHRLTASGIAIGSAPIAHRVDYKLETLDDFITSGLFVTTRGQGWSRTLDLRRATSGKWSIRTKGEGFLALPDPGGAVADFAEALDCDLALSPLTNSMPVLRHRMLDGGGPVDFLMAWVSLPDLAVYASGQRYTFVRKTDKTSVIRYETRESGFTSDVTFDDEGLVVDYPNLGRRLPAR
jgi:hypothetical protein